MNLMHIKYAVEVANEGSINKAAEKLYVGQPNLSRAIKELEASLGVKIFERSAKGMGLTSDGETFIRYAKTILRQVDEVESIFNGSGSVKKRFSISVPRASYISDAFARFSHSLTNEAEAEIIYKETNSLRAIKNILHEDYKLGIIRYAENYDKYFKTMLDEKDMQYEMITEFSYVLAMSRDNPLASAEKITFDALKDYIEIAHADPYVPSLPSHRSGKRSCPIISAGAYSYLSAQASLSCFRRIPRHLCGSRLSLRSCSTDMTLFRSLVRKIRRYIKIYLFISVITSSLRSIRRL